MARLTTFTQISLDGYFTDADGDLSWAHSRSEDPEFKTFVEGNASGGGALVFGRVTYEMMKSYWPTPQAAKNDPVVAERMNAMPKFVFSKKLKKADWKNTTVLSVDPAKELKRLKKTSEADLVILGSGTIVGQVAETGLVDEFQFVIIPIVLGKGRTVFDGVKKRVGMTRTSERAFKNGNLFVTYAPEK